MPSFSNFSYCSLAMRLAVLFTSLLLAAGIILPCRLASFSYFLPLSLPLFNFPSRFDKWKKKKKPCFSCDECSYRAVKITFWEHHPSSNGKSPRAWPLRIFFSPLEARHACSYTDEHRDCGPPLKSLHSLAAAQPPPAAPSPISGPSRLCGSPRAHPRSSWAAGARRGLRRPFP